MATKEYFLDGICKYAKLTNETMDQEYGYWGITLNLDESSMESFIESGAKLGIKEDEEGEKWITFKRKKNPTPDRELGPPAVLFLNEEDAEGWNGKVGNGSNVTIQLEVFDTSKNGKGTRLVAVRINDLVVYEGPEAVVADGVIPF